MGLHLIGAGVFHLVDNADWTVISMREIAARQFSKRKCFFTVTTTRKLKHILCFFLFNWIEINRIYGLIRLRLNGHILHFSCVWIHRFNSNSVFVLFGCWNLLQIAELYPFQQSSIGEIPAIWCYAVHSMHIRLDLWDVVKYQLSPRT